MYIYKYLAIKTPNSIQEQNATSTKKDTEKSFCPICFINMYKRTETFAVL